jgi:tRNA(adenine34) deaminase
MRQRASLTGILPVPIYQPQDLTLMEVALAEARAGEDEGEVPVGAVLAIGGEIIARAHNQPIGLYDPTAHAEILVLRAAAIALKTYRLVDASVYVTLEPCTMCIGAMVNARIARLFFGARDPKAGAAGSIYDIGRDGRLNHRIEIYPGVAEARSAELLQRFFSRRRV